ncbi:NAD(P)/FAD-dependent oxidoreductase [Pseudonocardia sp. RS11V-5]|uniref:flavin-containing monooxygenase n=1 Tax=Pseudonocardia terrae TaxID=2905831 RepID=UPI001E3D1E86|nr:NAD(P)/FAD-dependent oxidoreductase [Pseudonocardia terrae]MCE3551386.1 NAD(P)/FAD-dependent oxidoreductase [Pseudonocardia terrae]
MNGAVNGALDVDVAVVGAGFAGLGMAVQLARRARESFVVLERADEVGGTWRDNVYPGVACDVPSHLYSLSFAPKHDWTRVYAGGAEIQQYLRDVVRHEGLRPHLRFGAEMLAARWDGRWTVETTAGTVRARVLVMAAGRLSEPRIPDFPGLANFPGPVVHSAQWDPTARLDGLRIGLCGSGASAVQIAPHLAERTEHLVLFQRSAPWIVPRQDRRYTPAEQEAFVRDPAAARRLRAELFTAADRNVAQRFGARPAIDELRDLALGHLAAQVPDERLRARLTPDYEIGCKRVLLSDDFYPTVTRPDVTLVSAALERLEGRTAVARNGERHELDALVLATGFLAAEAPFAGRVTGRDEIRLADHWSRGMTSYASTVVSGFPNLFVLDGPNASLGHNSAIHMIETQIEYVRGALDHLAAHPGAALEVTPAAERAYTRQIDARSAHTVWLRGGCRSWYVDPRSGRLTLLWPGSAQSFRDLNGTFDPAPYH